MAKRRSHGEGSVDQRGENVWRLRYRVGGKRFAKTFRGTKTEAQKALRDLLHAGDTGAHVDPDKQTLGAWAEHWLSIGAPSGRRRRRHVSQRSLERYNELLRLHVLPKLGIRPLQQVQASELDQLYEELAEKVSPTLANNVHQVLVSCLGTAFRTRKLARNPIAELAKVPVRGDVNHGKVLDDEELQTLVQGFKGTVLYPIVAVAAFTGARRNEILSLRWDDLNIADSTLRIERTLEETDRFGLRTKEPKTARGERTIKIDGDLLSLLLAERDRHLRIAAGIPDSAPVDLSLVKLPTGALMFPSSPPRGESFSFTRLRNPRVVTAAFVRRAAKLGFPGLRFHDLRGSHETLLLDRGVPVHTVAARCGHDPAVLLRSYAKRTRKADDKAAEVIAAISKRALR